MRILIIGDCNSPYIIEQSKWLRKNTKVEKVDIFSTTVPNNNSVENEYSNLFCYLKNLDFEILSHFDEMSRHIIINYLKINEFKSLKNYYDIIQIHFVDVTLWSLIPYFKSVGKKIVASIWGSDLLRSTKEEDRYRAAIYESADAITITKNEFMIDEFSKKYQNIDLGKIYDIRYGADIFRQLQKTKQNMSKDECKKYLGLNPDDIVLTIGYNASEQQRHLEIIEQIINNNEIIKSNSKLLFFLPLTYGGAEEYKNKIINHCIENKLRFVHFDKYLSKEQVCLIRYASDIFIHLATTDDFCNSFREYLYADNVVITGKWFPYDGLKNDGFYFKTIDKLDKIGEELIAVLEDLESEKKKCLVNNDRLLTYSDWSVIINEWLQIYKNVIDDRFDQF